MHDQSTTALRCLTCGAVLIIKTRRDQARKKFCSRRCCSIHTQRKRPGKKFPHICRTCGKTFLAYPSQRKVFCGRACYYAKPSRWVEHGYINVPDRPRQRARVKEHQLIAERVLGRRLKRGEHVHHVNMDKSDNRHSNLLICSASYHAWLHQEYQRRFARMMFSPKPKE